MERFKRQGGRTMKKKIENIREVEQYDVVVNCTGIGARSLVNDAEVQPIRGQVIRVHAHWIKHFAITADAGHSSYVIPCANNVLLGGTTQVGNWNLKIDENDKKKIWEGCCKMYPSLKHAKLDYDWVGLRPSRTSVRLEKEIMNINGREIKVVHNYGHGGSGVTFHWGCAQDTTTLVSQLLGVKTRRTPTAKL
ncbi:D-amino-acid oxidase-like [Saccoglossus kowalevskii]